MPNYEIKAPDGNTYSIQGPDGATDEQVRQKVLEQHPNAANPTQAKAAPSRLQSFASDFSGIMKQRQAEAQQGVNEARKMPLSFINPVAGVKEFGANMQGALSPAYALGAALGRQVDPTFGKPGSAGGEDVKYGQLGEALVPIPAQKLAAPARVGGQVIARALEQAAPRVAETAGSLAKGFSSGGSKIGSLIDAGATPAAESVRTSAMAKILEQQQILANAKKAVENRKAADAQLRPAMERAAAVKESRGISPADTPEAQKLVADLQGRLNPNGPIAPIPNADQRAAYQKVIDVLAPKSGPKPDFATVQGLRRDLATAYSGDQTGFAALNKGIRKELAESLNAVENAHTEGLQAPVQQNYTALIEAQKQAKQLEKIAPDLTQASIKMDSLSPKESVKIAQSIVDKMQKRGLVPQGEYENFVNLAQNAKDAAGKSTFRKRVLLIGAGAAGLATPLGHLVFNAAGVP
jgi:hypothetical protein